MARSSYRSQWTFCEFEIAIAHRVDADTVYSTASPEIEAHDLWAAFTLVPQSPSLLDHMTGYTTWNKYMTLSKPLHPARFAQSPLLVTPATDPVRNSDAEVDSDQVEKNMALESFGVVIPLIQRREVATDCSGSLESGIGDGPDSVVTPRNATFIVSR